MKIIEKIKRLFEEKEKQDVIEERLSIQDIKKAYKNKEVKINNTIEDAINKLYPELLEINDSLINKIENLKRAEIKKKKVDERIKHIVLMGRDEFVKYCINFSEDIQKIQDSQKIIEYANLVYTKFVNQSKKSYYKTTELIGPEVKEVMDDITKIMKLIHVFSKDHADYFKGKLLVEELDVLFDSFNLINDEKKLFEKNKLISKNKFKELESEEIKLKEKIEETNKSSDAIKKEKLSQEINELNSEIISIFSNVKLLLDSKLVEKSMYHETDKKKLNYISEYLKNPFEVFIKNDPEIFFKLTRDVKNRIENNLISVKNPDKIISRFNFTSEKINESHKRIIELQKSIKILDTKFNSIKINVDELINQKKSVKIEKERLQKEISVFSEKKEEISNKLSSIEKEIRNKYLQLKAIE